MYVIRRNGAEVARSDDLRACHSYARNRSRQERGVVYDIWCADERVEWYAGGEPGSRWDSAYKP